MDFLSLYYFLELTKDLHFTNTAERLYISQQTLSNTISRLENELGVKLIERAAPKSLTNAGELVKKFAIETLNSEKNLKYMLEDISDEKRGEIFFGASALRMNTVIQELLPIFSQKYPLVTVHLKEDLSTELITEVENGELDIVILASNSRIESLPEENVFHDQVYYCIKDSLLEKHFADKKMEIIKESLSGIDFRKFVDIPTCILNTQIGKKLDNIFSDLNIKLPEYTICSSLQTSANIGLTGQAAFFATKTSLGLYSNTLSISDDNVYVFPIYYKGKPVRQYISLSTQKKQYQTQYLTYFKELLEEKLHSIEYSSFATAEKD